MKKIKKIIMFLIFILILIISNKVFAADDTTKLLYQDITINKDGSITVKEAAWLEGEYNGRLREIEYKNLYAVKFTGIYSNFTGNSDIYDGSSIKNMKIYDISQNNFKSLEDLTKIEKTYKEVSSASNGKYGVFIKDEDSTGVDLKIFCPYKKKKVICMEYTITDAVVVHNDVAELYWNVLGDNYREDIEDFKVLIHLPSEDEDVRIWTHGPLSGYNQIIDSKTLLFQDSNVDNYTAETVRIMFDKGIVPLATKKSNVDGREYILKFESMMADEANAERELKKLNFENEASEAVLKFEENSDFLFYYHDAMEYVNKLEDNNEQKQVYLDRLETALTKQVEVEIENVEEYSYIFYYNDTLELINLLNDDNANKKQLLKRLEACKPEVNKDWQESLDWDIELMTDNNYRYLNEDRINDFIESINQGFDEECKAKYMLLVDELKENLEEKNERIRNTWLWILIISYAILLGVVLQKANKLIKEKNKYQGKYYREFPSEDNPYVIEYLMNKKITTLSFTATILNLIAKKVVKIEKNQIDEKDIQLKLVDENQYLTDAELSVIEAVFDVVGNNNVCSLKELKVFAKRTSNAITLKSKIDKFNRYAAQEAKRKRYFEEKTKTLALKVLICIHYIIMFIVMIAGVNYKVHDGGNRLIGLILISIISYISFKITSKDKGRTELGKEEYSKWLAHKRYLQHFSNFDEKDLPEVILWEKYLVTATILGCADKVQKRLKLYIANTDNDYYENLLIYRDLNFHYIIRNINSSINTSISVANSELYSSGSSSSSGGFGGGSSGGGGRRWTAEAAEVVSNNTKGTEKVTKGTELMVNSIYFTINSVPLVKVPLVNNLFRLLSLLFAFYVQHLFLLYLGVCHTVFYLYQDQVQV